MVMKRALLLLLTFFAAATASAQVVAAGDQIIVAWSKFTNSDESPLFVQRFDSHSGRKLDDPVLVATGPIFALGISAASDGSGILVIWPEYVPWTGSVG